MLGLFKKNEVDIESSDVIKEGWLSKESKFRKIWRERWCVLTMSNFCTFEKERVYSSPTENIEIKNIKTIKSDDNTNSYIFRIETTDGTFQFQAKSLEEKEGWLGCVGKIMVQQSKPGLFITEDE